jgi:hypothetical protein
VDLSRIHGIFPSYQHVGISLALSAYSFPSSPCGATGILEVPTLCLVPRVVDALKVPVIGGVADGRGFLAVS